MAAAGRQDARLPRRDHRGAQIEARHRPPGALRHAVGDPGDAGRPVEPLLDAPGDDADHAGMPALAPHQQRGMARRGLRLGRVHRGVQHRRLDLLALAVDRVQRAGQRRGLHPVLAQQQAQAQIGLG